MPERKKVMFILSQVDDSKEFDLLADHWDPSRFELVMVLLNANLDSKLQQRMCARGHTCFTIPYKGRSSAPRALWRLYRLMRRVRPSVVNTNLLDATVLGLIAARLARVPLAIYTRHHTTHNHKYHPGRGVFYDRVCNRLAHRIIAISQVTREVLVELEGVPPEKIVLIPHGFDLSKPKLPDPELSARLRAKYGLDEPGRGPVIGVVARPYEWKGLDHTLAAFAELVRERPGAFLLLFNWHDTDQSARYQQMLDALPPGSWKTVWFESDVLEVFHAFDVFVHVPEDARSEAFGLVFIEALTTGTPSVFTPSGIMHELPPDGLHGVRFVPFKDAAAIGEAIRAWLAEHPSAAQRAEWARANTAKLSERLGIARRLDAFYALFATA